MTDPDRPAAPECRDCLELAPELALRVLPGRDRARVIAHAENCPTCRRRLAQLSDLADGLVALLPPAEPPAGFESRVLDALPAPDDAPTTSTAPAAPFGRAARPRRSLLAAAAAAVLVASVAGGWALGHVSAADAPRPAATGPERPDVAPRAGDAVAGPRVVRFASLTTGTGQVVGRAYAYPGRPPWLYMAVDADTETDTGETTVSCELLHRHAPPTPVGTFTLDEGYAVWATPAPVDDDTTAARLIDEHGTVVATATF